MDGDGRFDLFTANYGPNGLFLNRGGGKFDDGTVTGGTSYRDHLFRNTGTTFEDVTPENVRALQADHGALWLDIDRDGDEDLALTGTRADGMHLVLRNLLPAADARRAVRIRVLDGRRRATLAGAEVRVFAAGTRRLVGARLVDSGSGYDSQNDISIHVGLGTAARVDVEITSPGAGRRKVTSVRGIVPRGSPTILVK